MSERLKVVIAVQLCAACPGPCRSSEPPCKGKQVGMVDGGGAAMEHLICSLSWPLSQLWASLWKHSRGWCEGRMAK